MLWSKDAEWMVHINSRQGFKPQMGRMHVDDGTGTHHNMRCYMSTAAAAGTFNANRWSPCEPKISIAQTLKYFDRVISHIACCAAGPHADLA